MADPFGTGAGIIGCIGLAIQITQVIAQFGMDWKDAPDNVKKFMAELGTLKTVLSETNTNLLLNTDFAEAFQNRPSLLLSQLGPKAPSTTDTNLMLEICRRELDLMLKELKKRGQGHRLGWERLKGAFLGKDTRNSVENLCRQCQTLNNMLSIDTAVLGATTYKEVTESRKEQREWHQAEAEISLVIRGGVDESNRWQENRDRQRERQTILDWLTPIDFVSQQHDFITRRQEGTGQWILDSIEYTAWVETDEQTLFCPGIPGAGKTILTSIVVEDLTTRFRNDKSVGIAYLYCNFQRQHEQTLEGLIAILLKHLLQRLSSIPTSVKNIYDEHKDKQTRPSVDEILKNLESVITTYSRVYIVVDALDEYQLSGGYRSRFLSSILGLQAKTGAKLFVASRPIPDIEKEFKSCLSLEILASDEDIRKYLSGHMSQLPNFIMSKPKLQEEIKREIVQAAEGMFLLAQLYLGSLEDKTTVKAIKTALKQFQKKSQVVSKDEKLIILSLAYEQVMERIKAQQAGFKLLAENVLSWITCAKRPLTISELQHAIAVEVGETEIDSDNLPETGDMVSVCAGLVTIDKESGIIRLVHYTTQEYFERTQKQWFPHAEDNIAITCVTYLSFGKFESGICQTDEEFKARLRLYPLYGYSARNWGFHVGAVSENVIQLTLDLLEDGQKASAATQAMVGSGPFPAYSQQQLLEQVTGVHLATFFALNEVILALLKKGHHPDSKDSSGQTPLSWAAENGHIDVVRLLLEKGADIESKDNNDQSPLLWAIRNGYEKVVELLLEKGAKLESKDKMLLLAARRGHESVVRLLLEKDAKLESKDNNSQTPLSWAARNGREAVVKLLLATENVDVNSKDSEYGQTPLSWAAKKGHEAVVRLLLAVEQVEADLEDTKYGQTPLSHAAENGHEAIVKLLLATARVNIDSKDNSDRTPLSYAASRGNEAVVQLLLEKGADVESKGKHSQTPLSHATSSRHEGVVRILREYIDENNMRERKLD